MGDPAPDLDELVGGELFAAAPRAAALLAAEIVRRHGAAVAAVLFYGSCLRRRDHLGVMDFYVLVDSYPAAYHSRALTWANSALPPNVFYLEIESELGTLRSKYAVVSTGDFARGAGPGGFRSGLWARFCQPAMAVYARDEAGRKAVLGAVAAAVVTAVQRVVPLLAEADGALRFTPEELWQRAFRETYACELRTESPETIRSLYRAAPARFDRAARAALSRLAKRGELRLRIGDSDIEVELPAGVARRTRRSWALRRPVAKLLNVLGLLKGAATFGDWLPYVLWKLERHTGTRIVPSERQRRHPFLWGWPLLFRVLWHRDLR